MIALATPQLAMAQEIPADSRAATDSAEQEIVIEGFRASLDDILRQKRDSVGVADFVPLGDIGDLPTSNIAETLEFVPGVIGTRFRGTVEDISMRGLPSLLTLTTVNGRELTSKSGTRSVGFRIWPSEFFTRAGVYKSAVASITEGGIAGTVDLSTPSPLDLKPGMRVSGRMQYSPYSKHNDRADDTGKRLDVFGSQKFDLGGSELGIAFGFNHTDEPALTATGNLGPFVELTIRGQRAIVPSGATFAQIAESFERNALLGVVEWRSDSGFAAKLDGIYIDAYGLTESNFQQFAGLNAAARWPTATIVGGAIQTGTLTGISATSRVDRVPNQNYAWMLGGNFSYERGGWKAALDIYASRTTELRFLDRVTLITTGVSATATFTPERMEFTNFNKDLANPAVYGVNQYAASKSEVDDQAKGAQLSLSRSFEGSFIRRIGIGGRYMERHLDSLENVVLNNDVRNAALFPQFAVGKLAPGFFATTPYLDFNLSGSTRGTFPAPHALLDFDFAIGAMPRTSFPITDTVLLTGAVDNREKNWAAYAEADFGAGGLSGTLGVRLVRTELTARGYTGNLVATTNPVTGATVITVNGLVPATERKSYTEVLPSLNLKYELTRTLQARLALGRAISRPNFFDQRLAQQLNGGDTVNQPFRGTAGNPQLEPIRSDQVDLTLEWYPERGTAITLGGYYKRVDGFITDAVRDVEIAGLQYQLSSPVNTNAGDFYGIEGLIRKDFSFLPAPFDGFGIIASGSYNWTTIDPGYGILNATAADGSFIYDPADRDPGVEGFTKATATAILYFEKGPFSARGSARYASERVRAVSSLNAPLVSNERVYFDASASIGLLDNLKLQFGVNNITEVIDDSYYVFRNYTGVSQQPGRVFYFGLDFKL
ncbi:TonB-dependent receptor [Sphingomonas sp. BT-65]|uniref:TonB-dependent receptor n=1 Tax=Sphingomonas sp. BT-65 TaxID=2989821 RepID=UPI002235925E|nr:TonB-dependent receptor [Sphingomonas sp. BT-65]MCW4462017.1 TonB-dependent receptor [Sphingomonas sp. BT-65]